MRKLRKPVLALLAVLLVSAVLFKVRADGYITSLRHRAQFHRPISA